MLPKRSMHQIRDACTRRKLKPGDVTRIPTISDASGILQKLSALSVHVRDDDVVCPGCRAWFEACTQQPGNGCADALPSLRGCDVGDGLGGGLSSDPDG